MSLRAIVAYVLKRRIVAAGPGCSARLACEGCHMWVPRAWLSVTGRRSAKLCFRESPTEAFQRGGEPAIIHPPSDLT
jgi:hypothetical protein